MDDRTASEQTISGPGVVVYLMEEMTDARLRCEQLKHYVAEAADLVSKSDHRDHFWEVAGHLMQGIPESLFKLDKALSAAALAAGKLDHEALKQNIRPEKADELERVLEDARIRYVQRRSGEGTMIDPKTAAASLRSMADTIDQTGQFPLGPVVTLLASLEDKEPVGVAPRMASIPCHGLVVPAQWLRTLADRVASPKPNRAKLAGELRRVLIGAVSSDMLALLQTATSREDVEKGFEKENPGLSKAQLKEIGDQWEANRDVVKDKQAAAARVLCPECGSTMLPASGAEDVFLCNACYKKGRDDIYYRKEGKKLVPTSRPKTAGNPLGEIRDMQKYYDWLKWVVGQYRSINDAMRGAHAYSVTTKNDPLRKAVEKAQDGLIAMMEAADDIKRYGGADFSKAADDKAAADMSPALTAFATTFDTAKATWMAARRGNERLTATMGLGTIANMSGALAAIAPEQADALGRITSQALRLLPILKSEAAKGDVLTAAESDKDAKHEKGKEMTLDEVTEGWPQDKKDEFKRQNEEHKDQFKAAARVVPIEEAKKGDMVEVEVGTPWPRDSKKEKVTGKVVRVKVDGTVTVDVEKTRENPGGHSNGDVGYVDFRLPKKTAAEGSELADWKA